MAKEVVVLLSGYSNVDELEKKVHRIVSAPAVPILVDLEGITFILPSVVREIVRLYKHCKKSSVSFRLINMSPRVRETFDTLNLTKRFEELR